MNTAQFCIKHKVTTLLAVIMISVGKTWIFACFADISILQGSYALKNFTQLWGGGGGV